MSKWNNIKISNFLYEREGIYKPNNPKVKNLKRLQKIDFAGNIHFVDKKSKTNMIIIKQGDLVISGINVSKGALAVYEGKEDITATIHYSSYTFNRNKISIDFLKLFLKSPKFILLLKNQVKGGIKTEIKPKHILSLEIKLPDKSEQEKIVNVFNNIGKSIVDLNNKIINQQSLIKRLYQTILQEAVEGKLTADWRKKHPELISGENNAESLLKKIKIEKEQLIKERKTIKQKPLPPISEEEKPFKLPEGWVWCRLGELSSNIHYGFTASAKNNIEEPKLLRITDIQNNKVNWSNVPGCTIKDSDINKYLLSKGDILIARTGGTIGKTFQINNLPCRSVFASYLIRVILKKILAEKFIKYFMESQLYWRQLINMSWGAGQPNVNATNLRKMNFPLPPISEQHIIVKRVDDLMNIIGELEKQVIERKEQTVQLMHSVLREAFKQK